MSDPETIGVAGVGLIGGSIALRLRARGRRVLGYDSDPAVLAAARAAGALDDVAADAAALAAASDVVALAMPVDAVVAVLARTDALARPALVFDVASVKAPVAAAGRRFSRFVPSHPLAGRERGGFEAADPRLFEGRPWVVDPSADADARARLSGLIAALGAYPVELDADAHDRLVALTSHLPQMLSVILGERLAAAGGADPRAYAVCGPGIASMLRLARSPGGLWESIARANAGPLAAELRAAGAELERLAAELERGETAPLVERFERAHAAVDAVDVQGRTTHP